MRNSLFLLLMLHICVGRSRTMLNGKFDYSGLALILFPRTIKDSFEQTSE